MQDVSEMRYGQTWEPRHWEGGAHFQAWYPVHVAKDLLPGKIVGREFLGTKVVVYRDPEGKAVVQSAYCPHLGADLSDGEIVDGQVRCPYHYWQFGPDGFCKHIPSGTKPPRAARLFNYPTAERWGLIWAFNGSEPLYEVPSFDGVENDYIYMARERPDLIYTDAWIQGTNGLDFQHLVAVHNFPAVEIPEVTYNTHTIDFKMTLFHPEGKIRLYSANCNVAHQVLPLPVNNYVFFVANAPKPGLSQSFWVAAVKQAPGESRADAEARLANLDKFLFGFFSEDEYVLNKLRLRPRGQAALIKDDMHLARFLDWLDTLPKMRPFDA